MKVRCHNCGALHSLDSLVTNDAASDALRLAFEFSGELGKAWVQYLGLFRPTQSQLSLDRVAKITVEVIHDVRSGRIVRNGQTYDAPVDAWIYAIDLMIKARDEGRLKLPLKNHNYLYEVISGYNPANNQVLITSQSMTQKQLQVSKTMLGIAALQGAKRD